MNTKLIKNTNTHKIPHFPCLTANKCTKVVTKHLGNVGLYLSSDRAALLWWLLYQSGADNTIIYNTNLLRKYSKAIIESNKLYSSQGNNLKSSLTAARHNLQWLIREGYLFWHLNGKLIINPSLTYYERLSRKDYFEFMTRYNRADGIEDIYKLIAWYIELVKSKM